MLNPMNPLHIRLGRWLFQLPHNQRRWHHYMGYYLPILKPAFENNEAARLLVLKVLKRIDCKNFKGAIKVIQALIPVARAGTPAEKALCGVLSGLVDLKAGDFDQAARRFKGSNEFNHRFFLPYLLAADYEANQRQAYPQAAANYQTAVDCIYEYPPLTDITRHLLCMAYGGLCLCHVMMHSYDEAKADLMHAEQVESENQFTLHSRAYLHAALRQKQEARACLKKYNQYGAEESKTLSENIERILAEKDPHFTQLPIGSPEGIAAFWQNFLDREDEIMRLLRLNQHTEAFELMVGPLREMDPYHDSNYGVAVRLNAGIYTLSFWCQYSRTYTPFVQDILAACPPEIHERWRIKCDP